mmetsp:Transcript_11746/g.26984  ORF Transcript_11746/g.26984 Transcript_11746/m.26984 type:complete len:230 (+) Transcript_11746:292-981(+)
MHRCLHQSCASKLVHEIEVGLAIYQHLDAFLMPLTRCMHQCCRLGFLEHRVCVTSRLYQRANTTGAPKIACNHERCPASTQRQVQRSPLGNQHRKTIAVVVSAHKRRCGVASLGQLYACVRFLLQEQFHGQPVASSRSQCQCCMFGLFLLELKVCIGIDQSLQTISMFVFRCLHQSSCPIFRPRVQLCSGFYQKFKIRQSPISSCFNQRSLLQLISLLQVENHGTSNLA